MIAVQSITVTIGRNVGPNPLPAPSWRRFRIDAEIAFRSATCEVWTNAEYSGEWDGVSEDALILHGPARSAAAVEVLRKRLAVLAGRYRQDAIGLSVGSAELVESLTVADLLDRHAALGRAD